METVPGTLCHSEISGRRKGQKKDQEGRALKPSPHSYSQRHLRWQSTSGNPLKWMDNHLTHNSLACSAHPSAITFLGASYESGPELTQTGHLPARGSLSNGDGWLLVDHFSAYSVPDATKRTKNAKSSETQPCFLGAYGLVGRQT